MLGFPDGALHISCASSCRACQAHPRCLLEALRASPVVYADETGWKQGGRLWLWVFTNLRETVYEILPGRGFEQAASVLGKNYAGTLGVDGWAPYRFKEATLQTCYNHLLHLPRATGDGHARGGALPTLGQGHPPAALALRDRRDAGEISPHGLRVAKGLTGEDEPPAARPTPILPTSDSRNICDAMGQPLCVPRPCGRRGHQLSPRHSHRRGQPQDCGGGNRTSILMSGACRHKGIRVIDIVTQSFESPWSTQSGKQLQYF